MDEAAEKKAVERKGPNFLLVGTGTMFTAMVISGFLVGYVFDEILGTRPIAMLICGVLGMIGGMMKVHQAMSLSDRRASTADAQKGIEEGEPAPARQDNRP